MTKLAHLLGTQPEELCRDLQKGKTENLKRRRGIIGLSLIGMGAMAAVSLLQTGIVKHLPDPPLDSFNSDKVNSSYPAYMLGVPDGTVSLASFATNIPISAFGGSNRAQERPWIPLFAAGKAGIEAMIAAWYFYQMPAREKKWCGYCIVGALASFGVLVLTIPEATEAMDQLRKKIVRTRSK